MTAGMVSVPAIIPLKKSNGSKKTDIDTSSLIAIHSDTKDSVLFYTVDGSKPDPFKKIGETSTFQYTKPFKLGPGKQIVRAIAVLRDGSKESSINTKVFQVKFAIPSDNELIPEEVLQRLKGDMQQDEPDAASESGILFKNVLRSNSHNPDTRVSQDIVKKVIGVRSCDEPVPNLKNPQVSMYCPPHSSVKPNKTATLGNVDTVFACLKCLAPRPRDPYARFCSACGMYLPPAPGSYRTPSAGDPGKCSDCGAKVPLNTRYCLFCEKRTPDSHGKEKKDDAALVCGNCGTINPPSCKLCLVCENQLALVPAWTATPDGGKEAPPPPASEFILCPVCQRVNSGDARFCDWCSKRFHFNSPLQCQSCTGINEMFSKYCCSCGVLLSAPPRKEFHRSLLNALPGSGVSLLATLLDGDAQWIALPTTKSSKSQVKHMSTQTSGTFYSSTASTELEAKANTRTVMKSKSERGFPLTAVSPGKGFWRQQVDHITYHFKMHAQNDLDFRRSICNLRISKLLAAVAQEEMNGAELTITASFALKRDTTGDFAAVPKVATVLSATDTNALSRVERQLIPEPAEREGKPEKSKKEPLKVHNVRNLSGSLKMHKISPESKLFLEELKSSDPIDLETMERLVSDGADVNSTDENGIPFLKLAVIQKHFEALQFLIDHESDLDRLSGVKKTSALHEAVLLGISGKQAIAVLLDNNASVDIKNAKGESPYDLAVSLGINAITSMFSDKAGSDLLKEVTKLI